MFKVFDFNKLSDTSQSILRSLTPGQLGDGDEIHFDINLAGIFDSKLHRDRFMLARRLYFEVDLQQYSSRRPPDGMKWRQSDRHFIDFIDYVPTREPAYLSGFWFYLFQILADPSLIM